jgi:hypothetical protein
MGFKINKGKSWSNASNNAAKDAFSKETTKRNNQNTDAFFKDMGKGIKEDTRKTAKAAGKGIKRNIDSINNMWIWVGIGGLGVVLLLGSTQGGGSSVNVNNS